MADCPIIRNCFSPSELPVHSIWAATADLMFMEVEYKAEMMEMEVARLCHALILRIIFREMIPSVVELG